MCHFQVWSCIDRRLGLTDRSNHLPVTHRKLGNSTTFILPMRHFPLASAVVVTIVLIALSGCGGLSFNGSGKLSGTPASAASDLTQISCGTQSLVGAQTKSCSVDLTKKTKSAVQVSLQTSNSALQVPATVSVESGAQSATFNIVSTNVTKTLSVTISGSAHGHKKSTVITLYPAAPTSASLTNVSCGTQSVTGPATETCSVSLSTSTTSPVVVALHSSSSYLTVPPSVSVPAGSTKGNFQAAVSGVNSQVNATITASLGGVSVSGLIQLNATSAGTPTTRHVVNLAWNPPSSLTDLAGYHIYRSTAGASAFQLLNSTLSTESAYADDTVASGNGYDYEVTSVNLTGIESAPSNITTVSIP